MRKVLKYLKPFGATIALIIMLLLVQALCDLALPGYTSNIVNVGIQQNGIENAVPKAIRKSELDKLLLVMDEADQKLAKKSYSLLDKSSLPEEDFHRYLQEYPGLSREPVYVLKTKDEAAIKRLNLIMGKWILFVSEMEKDGHSLSGMPVGQIEGLKKVAGDKLAQMPEAMITQSAIHYVRSEYAVLGMDTGRIQSRYILYTGGAMLLVSLLSMFVAVAVAYLGAKVAAAFSKTLRTEVFKKVVSFSNSEFNRYSTASLITRNTNDISQIQMFMIMLFRIVFYAPLLGVGGIIKVLGSDYSMGWIIFIAVAAIFTLVSVLFSIVIPKFKSIQTMVDRLNLVTREILSGMLVIRAFNTQRHEEKRFDEANRDLTETNLFVNRVMALMMPVMMLIMNGTTLLIVWIGAHQIERGIMQVGDMMAFIQYSMQIIMSFLMISMVSIMLPRAAVSAARIAEVLDTRVSIQDPELPESFVLDKRGGIEFKNVSFRYPGAEEDVLSGISFTALPGETTAIIGSTGSGKTTLVSLIPRFYDVTSGEILLQGTNIRKVSLYELREKIGYVPQKAVLFSGTIESNVGYGVENITGEELEKASRTAQALEFIIATPEGFQGAVSQGGANLSGGQKQRLAMARALAKKPELYIFDDCFSALDFKTDAELRRALKKETGQSTVLIVAQRISTIMDAQQIIVLEQGKIVGTGTHKELMKTCQVYRQIALSQLSAEELAI